jgi:CO/xanthine dehydrogenase FAD-binding subunit
MIRTESLADALEALAAADRPLTPIAGATDLFVSWHESPGETLELLDIAPLRDELGACELTPDRLRLPALTTYWDVITSDEVCAAFPVLEQAARSVGAVQIQTRGTWAGNVGNGSPAADGVLALMAYDAVVVLKSHAGRRSVPLDQYYTGYRASVRRRDELIIAIDVPRRARRHAWFYKVGPRRAQAITKVGVAVVQDESGWRVVANSVAPVVCRCRKMERALGGGQTFRNPAEIRRILDQDISPIDDLRSTAAYRGVVLSRLLYYWLAEHTPLCP